MSSLSCKEGRGVFFLRVFWTLWRAGLKVFNCMDKLMFSFLWNAWYEEGDIAWFGFPSTFSHVTFLANNSDSSLGIDGFGSLMFCLMI
jgi:hypothetical protein